MNQHSTGFLLSLLISGFAVLITSKLVPGFKVKGFFSACIAALVIGLANAILWPVLAFLTLPLTVITFGLFLFVVNGAVLKICAAILPNFEIDSWGSAIFGSIVLALSNMALRYLLI
jgi:putative membrane protein